MLDIGSSGCLIQFWAVNQSDEKSYLVTKDHPFSLINPSKGLWEYRKRSMGHQYLVNDGVKGEEFGPPGRVYRHNWPEWTTDLRVYSTREFPLRDYAIQCGLRYYMTSPIVLLKQNECVGVLEFFTSDSDSFYEYNSDTIKIAFEEANLRATHIGPPLWEAHADNRKLALKEVRDMDLLVANIPQLGKVSLWVPCNQCLDNENCMQSGWTHVYGSAFDMSYKVINGKGIIGTMLASESKLCFFANLCDFNITEEQGILEARQSRFNVCFAICLQSSYTGNDLYVIEFFLDQSCKTSENLYKFLSYLLPIMKETLKSFKVASGREFGEELVIDVITSGKISESGSLEQHEPNAPRIRFKIFQCVEEIDGLQTNDYQVVQDDGCDDLNSNGNTLEGEQNNISPMNLDEDVAIHSKKRGRRNREGSINITLQDLEPHYGKKQDVVAEVLGVSRSTIKRVCRENNIQRWPSNPKNKGNIALFRTPTSNHHVQSSKRQDFHGISNKNPQPAAAPLHILDTNTRECAQNVTKWSGDEVFIIAKFKNDMVKIQVNIKSTMEKLNQEVMRRFNIETGSFKLKYLDDKNNRILLVCDDDLHLCLKILKASVERKQQLEHKMDVVPPSLIVHVEWESDDQCPKNKKDGFETPKSSIKNNPILVDDSDAGDTHVASNNEQEIMLKYCGRKDYVGRDLLDAQDRQYLDCLLDGAFRGVQSIWSRGVFAVRPSSLINLLFDNAICGDVINSYLDILCCAKYRTHGISNSIAYLSTYTTANILSLVKHNTKYTMKNDGYEWVIDKMIPYCRNEVLGMSSHIDGGIRYIVVPINDENCSHWYMLIVDLQKKQIYEFDSMRGVASVDVQCCMVTFLTCWLKCLGHEMQSHVEKAPCQQQDRRSMDCGIYISLWSECLLRDPLKLWAGEAHTDIKWYRARMPCTILKDTPTAYHCSLPPISKE